MTDVYAPILSAASLGFSGVEGDVVAVAALLMVVLVAVRAVFYIYYVVSGGEDRDIWRSLGGDD